MAVTCKECNKHYPNAKQISNVHMKREHSMTLPEYEQKYGQYSSRDKTYVEDIDPEFRVECKICNFEFKNVVTTAHLKLHNITSVEYKEKYGDTYSTYEKNRRSDKVKGSGNPLYGKGHSDETKKKISETVNKQYKNGRVGPRTPTK